MAAPMHLKILVPLETLVTDLANWNLIQSSCVGGLAFRHSALVGRLVWIERYTQSHPKLRRFVAQDMSVSDEFQANIEALPNILQRKYGLLRDLDKSLQDRAQLCGRRKVYEIQRQNEQRCEQEIDDMKRSIKSGSITPNSSLLKFSVDALDEQKHAIRIADEKVALAVQAYDLVDAHIQQLDQYLKKLDEDLRRAERDAAASTGSSPTHENNAKAGKSGETSNRGRKKTRLATASASASAAATASAPTATNSTSMELDLPVDPNEPTYCFCNQVSYGEMVACDNPDCKIEWFHYGCVGLKEQPKGKWYCSECVGKQRRKKTK
ncbi:hypothetical protein CASFOL_034989 [Castilleja foliolosa]|uniref:PHD finger protein ING n=1 Tax=Castilleja foliolosa TaxID=1961234 RepID=A0ABD3BS38_9LAMI